MKTISALFVQKGGVYFGLDGVDPWDEERDARLYPGPNPVIAHPPCARWGRYWSGGPLLVGTKKQKKLGDDDGCFTAALSAVRKFGGVIEHPEASYAWDYFGLNRPPRSGGWIYADFDGGWTCCVEQGAYGHRARKATWLYAYGIDPPTMRWGKASGSFLLSDDGFRHKEERERAIKTGICQRLGKKERAATPIEFRDVLISIARSVQI